MNEWQKEWQLLRLYVEDSSEQAFTQLAGRYLNLVYSTCFREIGDLHLAEDATQVVFLLLARKAATLPRGTVLSGWLFHTARLVAKNIRRRERRRILAEQGAIREEAIQNAPGRAEMLEFGADGQAQWESVEPHLHTALSALRPPERNVLLLRFFEDRSLAEVGAALGLTEDAARMRVMRALEKMRRVLAKSGSVVSVAVLAGLLSERAVRASPASCTDALPRIAAGGLVAAKAGGVLAGWHIYQIARTITRALRTANLMAAATVVGVVVVATTMVPLILHRFRPMPLPPLTGNRLVQANTQPAAARAAVQPSLDGTMYVGGPTRAETARRAVQMILNWQESMVEMNQIAQEQDRLSALMMLPGNFEKLNQAQGANPLRFSMMLHPEKVIRGIDHPFFWELARLRDEERFLRPVPGAKGQSFVPIGALVHSPRAQFPPVLTVTLEYDTNGEPATLRLSGPTSQVLRQLRALARIKPHKMKAVRVENGAIGVTKFHVAR